MSVPGMEGRLFHLSYSPGYGLIILGLWNFVERLLMTIMTYA